MASFYDYSCLALSGTQTVLSAAGAFFQGPFRGDTGAPTLKRHVVYSAIRTFTRNATVKQMQMMSPSTTDAYKSFVKEQKLPLREHQLEDGTTCCWLGPEKSTKVMLFFHGGGYNLSATPGHFKLLSESLKKAEAKNGSLSICFLAYNLAPSNPYPSQLTSAIHAYKYLTETLQVLPSQLLLVGDSAGGNLALGLLSYIAHPRPDLPPITNSSAVANTFLLSPWVTFAQSSKSMQTNQYKDCLDRSALTKWSQGFVANAGVDNYNSPLQASPEWWQGLKSQAITISAGADEVFVDDIKVFAGKLQIHATEVKFMKFPDEAHDSPIIDFASGLPEGKTAGAFYEWVLSNCR